MLRVYRYGMKCSNPCQLVVIYGHFDPRSAILAVLARQKVLHSATSAHVTLVEGRDLPPFSRIINITMVEALIQYKPQLQSNLLCQPYDIRLEIYRKITLPPFDGHQAFAGLGATCRQLRQEFRHEAARQIRLYLNGTGKSLCEGYHHAGLLAHDTTVKDMIQWSTIFHTVKPPELVVTIPFLPPPSEHDWHHYYHPRDTSESGVAWTDLELQYDRQRLSYRDCVRRILGPLKQVFCLDFTCITFVLTLKDDGLLKQGRNSLAAPPGLPVEPIRRDRLRPLEERPIGRLVSIWMCAIGHYMDTALQDWLDNDGLRVTTTAMVSWDFSPSLVPDSPPSPQRWQTPASMLLEGRQSRADFSENRGEGLAAIQVNLEFFLRARLQQHQMMIQVLMIGIQSRTQDDHELYPNALNKLEKIKKKMEALRFAEYSEEYERQKKELLGKYDYDSLWTLGMGGFR